MLLTVTTRGDSAAAQQRQQVSGQREVPQMVGAELQFETVAGFLSLRWCHDAGVVDQDVDRPAFGGQLVTQRGNAFQ